VGSSVNRYLLESMARLGRGAVAYVGLDDEAGREVDMFYERIAHPALADVKIDWGRMRVSDVYPRSIPDVFVGRPVVLTGRFKCDAATQVRVSGRMGRERVCYTMSVDPGNLDAEHAGIRTVWGRWRIADLSDRELYAPSHRLRREITETSLKYRLLCRYTAFLAVDSLRRTSGDHGTTVGVPVPTPEGVRYETTVEER